MEKKEALEIELDREVALLFLNLAACLLKLHADPNVSRISCLYIVNGDELNGAKFACNRAIDILASMRSPTSADSSLMSKAYYRRASCYIEQDSSADLELAIKDLRKVRKRCKVLR